VNNNLIKVKVCLSTVHFNTFFKCLLIPFFMIDWFTEYQAGIVFSFFLKPIIFSKELSMFFPVL